MLKMNVDNECRITTWLCKFWMDNCCLKIALLCLRYSFTGRILGFVGSHLMYKSMLLHKMLCRVMLCIPWLFSNCWDRWAARSISMVMDTDIPCFLDSKIKRRSSCSTALKIEAQPWQRLLAFSVAFVAFALPTRYTRCDGSLFLTCRSLTPPIIKPPLDIPNKTTFHES